MKDFNLIEWKRKVALNENLSPISPAVVFSIYKHLVKRLDNEALEAGLRMSIFEQEFPTPTSFYNDLEESGALENIPQ